MEFQRQVIRFLEKEIKTYIALALFFAKRDVKEHVRAGGDKKVPIGPKFYKQRMKEAKKLVALPRQQLFVYRDLWAWIEDPFQPPPTPESSSEQLTQQLI